MVATEDSKSFAEKRGGSSPSTPTSYYDPAERAREKQLARDKDDEDLRTGKVTREELSKRNGFFSSLDFSKATIIRRDQLSGRMNI